MKTCIIYARTAESPVSLPQQIIDCIEYAKQHDLEVIEVFSDVGSGNTIENKNGLAKAMGMIATRPVDYFLVCDIGRIGRNMNNFLRINRILLSADCQLRDIQGNMDKLVSDEVQKISKALLHLPKNK